MLLQIPKRTAVNKLLPSRTPGPRTLHPISFSRGNGKTLTQLCAFPNSIPAYRVVTRRIASVQVIAALLAAAWKTCSHRCLGSIADPGIAVAVDYVDSPTPTLGFCKTSLVIISLHVKPKTLTASVILVRNDSTDPVLR